MKLVYKDYERFGGSGIFVYILYICCSSLYQENISLFFLFVLFNLSKRYKGKTLAQRIAQRDALEAKHLKLILGFVFIS